MPNIIISITILITIIINIIIIIIIIMGTIEQTPKESYFYLYCLRLKNFIFFPYKSLYFDCCISWVLNKYLERKQYQL